MYIFPVYSFSDSSPFIGYYKILSLVSCAIIGPCWLSILYMVVCICLSHILNSLPPFPFANHKFVFCVYFSFEYEFIYIFFKKNSTYKLYHMIFVIDWLTSL